MLVIDDTIVAIGSPLSPAARGVVRLSGSRVVEIVEQVFVAESHGERSLSPRRLRGAIDLGEPLAKVAVELMLWPTGRSYTGQPSAEIHAIGSLPILEAIVDRMIAAGARPARPGEFTMRAFLAGRLDLPQAEAVLGVIEAEDAGSLDQALSQLSGNLSKPLSRVREDLLNLLADIEAGLDFVDEDIEFIEDAAVVERLRQAAEVLVACQTQMRDRAETKHCTGVVLRGLPNAGKSRLLNTITDSDTAIVTSRAGTTRDFLTVRFEIDGQPFSITDTAGIETRSAEDADAEVLAQAQELANEIEAAADIRLWCVDGGRLEAGPGLEPLALPFRTGKSGHDVVLLTKADLLSGDQIRAGVGRLERSGSAVLPISSVSGLGIAELKRRMAAIAERVDAHETGSVIGTAARCRDSIGQAIRGLEVAAEMTLRQDGHEWVAAEIRSAVGALGEVTGEIHTDDILDRVFSRFCIGK